MNEALLRLCREEREALNRFLKRFAANQPAAANGLGLGGQVLRDSHLAIFLEAFAFLTARVRLRFEDSWPELTRGLLDVVSPHRNQPLPALTVLQFQSDHTMTVPRGTQVRPVTADHRVRSCWLRTCYDVRSWPVHFTEVEWLVRPTGLPTTEFPVAAGLRLLLRPLRPLDGTFLSKLGRLDRLRLYLAGDDDWTSSLYEALFMHRVGVFYRPTGTKNFFPGNMEPVGFDREDSLLPYPGRTFSGFALLADYFAYPRKHLFGDLTGLEHACCAAADGLDVFLLFGQGAPDLAGRPQRDTFRLGCTPAVNLFPLDARPISAERILERHEHPVIPGDEWRTAEVYSVDRVEELRPRSSSVREPAIPPEPSSVDHVEESRPGPVARVSFRPLFEGGHNYDETWGPTVFWTMQRKAAVPGEPRRVCLSVTNSDWGAPGLASDLGVITTCHNGRAFEKVPTQAGGRPLQWRSPDGSFVSEEVSCRTPCLWPPGDGNDVTLPCSALALALLGATDPTECAAALRRLLLTQAFVGWGVDESAGPRDDATAARGRALTSLLDSVRAVEVRPAGDGSSPGRSVSIELDTTLNCFPAGGFFLFASVLERVFALYSPINSFAQTTITTTQGAKYTWPHRIGRRTAH